MIIILTIKSLPFISLDASLALQFWLKKVQKNLEELIDKIERDERNKK